jgi:radical SAM superfamily enzyme YgiQ (UPF0313 family)
MREKLIPLYQGRLAKEKGAVTKDWGGRIRVALAYPNHYRIGMSNLGFLSVYRLLNERQDVVAERVFLPDTEAISLQVEAGKGLLSMESLSPLAKFDLIAFSLSFENDYPNILKILRLGRIPLFSQERDEAHPLIMAGGINTFLNPEPLASFFDFFLLGEAEPVLGGFIDRLGLNFSGFLPERSDLFTFPLCTTLATARTEPSEPGNPQRVPSPRRLKYPASP